MSKRLIERIAREIANELFVNGSGDRAQRLVLTIDTPTKRDLGGLCPGAVVDIVSKVLTREFE